MSGLGAFYSAVSGIKGNLFSMSIVGNNIANANTNGYKTGRATFQEAIKNPLYHQYPTVTADLHQILPGVAIGFSKDGHKDVINDLSF